MSERGGNNGPCIVGLYRGSGCLGWQYHKIAEMVCTWADGYVAADDRTIGMPNAE